MRENKKLSSAPVLERMNSGNRLWPPMYVVCQYAVSGCDKSIIFRSAEDHSQYSETQEENG